MKPLPVAMVHVRITSVVPIDELEPLKNAIRSLVESYAELYGVRIKRRRLTAEQYAALWTRYAERDGLVTKR